MEKQEMERKQKLETKTETGKRNWTWKLETEMGTKNVPITGEKFLYSVLSHYSSILLSIGYGTGFMSRALPLLLHCAL